MRAQVCTHTRALVHAFSGHKRVSSGVLLYLSQPITFELEFHPKSGALLFLANLDAIKSLQSCLCHSLGLGYIGR